VSCLVCGTPVRKYRSRPNKKFCSPHCANVYQGSVGTFKGANNPHYKGGDVQKVCATCKAGFSCRRGGAQSRKYCSRECARQSQLGRKLPASSIAKRTAAFQQNNHRKAHNHCPKCDKEIKQSSEYCQQHKHLTDGYRIGRIKQQNTVTGVMPKNIMRPGKFMNVQRGYFDINGRQMFFRSKWEANYALYLDFLIAQKQIRSWEYEAHVFIFEKIQSGTRSYRPDFKVFNNSGDFEYHEVKGWMDPKSKTKLKRMTKYYPKVKMVLVDSDAYRAIKQAIGKVLRFY